MIRFQFPIFDTVKYIHLYFGEYLDVEISTHLYLISDKNKFFSLFFFFANKDVYFLHRYRSIGEFLGDTLLGARARTLAERGRGDFSIKRVPLARMFDRGSYRDQWHARGFSSPFGGMYPPRSVREAASGGVCMQNSKPPLRRRRRFPSFDFARAHSRTYWFLFIHLERAARPCERTRLSRRLKFAIYYVASF